MNQRSKFCDIKQKTKDEVWRRDGECCILCGNPEAMPNAHYIPRSSGGLGVPENLVTLCCRCHEDYDHTVKRKEIKEQIREYLAGYYGEEWSEDKLKYSKWDWCK